MQWKNVLVILLAAPACVHPGDDAAGVEPGSATEPQALVDVTSQVLSNPGFEQSWTGWRTSGSVSISSSVHSGTRSAKITGSTGRFEQTIAGLRPATAYTVTAWMKGPGKLGVTGFGGTAVVKSANPGSWTAESVAFTTGATATSATVYGAYNGVDGRFDDFTVKVADSLPLPDAGAPAASSAWPVSAVSASADDGNLPANAVDGNLATRWSADGDGQWIQLDLGTPRTVNKIAIAWYRGDLRAARFDVLAGTSVAGLAPVFSGSGSGHSLALESFALPESTARFIRVVGHGNTVNTWNSITELAVSGTSGADAGVNADSGTAPPDAGTPVVLADAGAPTPDAGSPVARADAGTSTPDAGAPAVSTDAGTSTPDAGSPSSPWSFFAFGDTRSTPSITETIVRSMVALDPGAVALFTDGDITATGTASEWNAHLQALARGAPDPSVPADPSGIVRQSHMRTNVSAFGPYTRYLGVIGNHDVEDSAWLTTWNNYLPGQKSLGHNSTGGVYYALTYANALFVVMDSQHPSAAQTEWLHGVLQDSTAQWKFVWFHEPVYPCNDKAPFAAGLDWVQLMEQYRVDIAFVAHSHTYERTCAMVGGHCVPGGVMYLNSSAGGAPARAVDVAKRASVSSGSRTDTYDCHEILDTGLGGENHFCHVQVDGCRATLLCYEAQESTSHAAPLDAYTLDHCTP